MPDRLELNFETTHDDWVAFSGAYMERSPQWAAAVRQPRRAALKQVLWSSPFVIGGASYIIGNGESTRGMYVEGALCGLLLVGLMAFGLSRIDHGNAAKRAHLEGLRRADLTDYTGPAAAAIDPLGAEFRARAFQTRMAWDLVELAELGEFFYFSSGGTPGMIIPKRAFPAPADAAAFAQQAAEWRQAAKLPPAERLARYLADRDAVCPACGYNLRGVRGERCPECGGGLTLESLVGAAK